MTYGLAAKLATDKGLLTQVGEVRVCQVLGNFQAAMAKVRRCFIE